MEIHKESREHSQKLHLWDIRNGDESAVEYDFVAKLVLVSDFADIKFEVILIEPK